MKWSKANSTALELAAGWSAEGGPGGAILIFDAEQIRTEVYGGYSDLNAQAPFDEETVVRLASITKHFTAALALRAQDERAIDLSQSISDYLPSSSAAVGSVPLIRAMDMTGGLPDMIDTAWLLGVPRTAQLQSDAVLEFAISQDRLNFHPGSELSYSNAGYRILDAVLASQNWALSEALSATFFEALGLKMRLANEYAAPIPKLASGYWRGAQGWRHGISGMPYSGADALTGSARELAIWLQHLLADEAPVKGLLERLVESRHLEDGRQTDFGLGLTWFRAGGADTCGFGGQLPGYGSQFLLSRDNGCGIIVLSNREDIDSQAIALEIMGDLLDVPGRQTASEHLPDGMFITDEGPYWLSYEQGRIVYLGAGSPAYLDERNPNSVVGGPYMPLRLSRDDCEIVGEVGYVPRRFRPVPLDAVPDKLWAGRWEHCEQGASFQIELSSGEATITTGSGPVQSTKKLRPLGHGRALFVRTDGPRNQHVCLDFNSTDNKVRVVTNRSRVLEFHRRRI